MNERIPRFYPTTHHRIDTVANQPVMMQQSAFRKPCRARCVLYLHRVTWFWIAQRAAIFARKQRGMITQQNPVFDGGQLIAHRVCNLLHRIAAKLCDIVNRLGA